MARYTIGILLIVLPAVLAIGIITFIFPATYQAPEANKTTFRETEQVTNSLVPLSEMDGRYSYDFNDDGAPEYIRIKSEKISPELVTGDVIVYLAKGSDWQELGRVYGYFTGLSIWQKNLLVLITQDGKYLDYSFFKWNNPDRAFSSITIQNGKTEQPSISSTDGLYPLPDNPYWHNAVFVPPGYYSSRLCPNQGDIYTLVENKLIKSWSLQSTDEWCDQVQSG